MYATYGAGPTQVDVTGHFTQDVMQASDPKFAAALPKLGLPSDFAYTGPADRMYDHVGDVAYGRKKYVNYGYTDASGGYHQDVIDDSFGTVPGTLIKSLRQTMGLQDATAPVVAPAQTAFQQQTAANAAWQATQPTK
jgi:hypothetical protein